MDTIYIALTNLDTTYIDTMNSTQGQVEKTDPVLVVIYLVIAAILAVMMALGISASSRSSEHPYG